MLKTTHKDDLLHSSKVTTNDPLAQPLQAKKPKQIVIASKTPERHKHWNCAAYLSEVSSEAANVGIVLDVATQFIHFLKAIPGLETIALTCEALIYFFKALRRLIFLIGHKKNKQFEDYKHGTHRYQTMADVLCILLFTATILFLLGIVVANPLGTLIGWTLGFIGLCIIGYFDYSHQAKQAKKTKTQCQTALDNAKLASNNDGWDQEAVALHKARKDYMQRRDAKRLYMGLLAGLFLLLVCGSLAAVAPPMMVPVLLVMKYIGMTWLVSIAVGRFVNFCLPSLKKCLLKLFACHSKEKSAKENHSDQRPQDEDTLSVASTTILSTSKRWTLFGCTPCPCWGRQPGAKAYRLLGQT